MRNLLLILSLAFIITACNQTKISDFTFTYPQTIKVDTTDIYFGTEIADPYRWLENDTAADVAEWVTVQNKITFDYLDSIPFRNKIKNRLTNIWNYPKSSAPFKRGGRYFLYKNDGLQNQSVLFVKNDIDAEERILLDPNTLSEDGTVALAGLDFSKDGKLMTYSIARAGSDWNEIFVLDVETGQQLDEHILWVKFTSLAWHNNGFYYSGYTPPEEGKEFSNKNEFHKLYYHKLGTPQTSDKIIMENKELPLRMFVGDVTDDEKYMIVYEENAGDKGQAIHIKDLSKEDNEFKTIVANFDDDYSVIGNVDNVIYMRTNYKAPKYKLVSFNFDNYQTDNFNDILTENENVLQSISMAADKFVATYMKDAHNIVQIFDYTGKYVKDIDLPTLGTARFGGNKDYNIAFYTFTSFTYPSVVYKYDLNTFTSEEYSKSQVDFDGSQYETKQIFYKSKDGTKIPMFIVHKKGITLDGNNPTLLYGYGGFNISLTPGFRISRLIWLENGGVYVLANLRGGGEYGEEWHEAGTKLKKQNVFDDFIAAAEYLIENKYTSPQKLVIEGGSNGGLLVGTVANQRPDLFKVALPAVGVMDMLRYQKFTIGWGWVSDYGSSDDSIQFNNLIKYSPLHNIKENVEYPATLVTTADHDDRVVPAHSFKYIATLQEKYQGKNPVMIRIDVKAGHGGGKPTSKIIEEKADIYSFIFFNMGIAPKY